ncbi:MAG: 5'-methylthioadenosine/adenosylhomocysteine nucleosidase [Oscillospiraceae bacterium]|nr:5'-methylthioadenosine/adenosylhomocysteine nucleosidase [Oscillospiraceae bacterium]
MNNIKFGIIGAMDSEVNALIGAMENAQETVTADMHFFDGVLCGVPAVVVKCGMGKVNAGICAQILITCFHVTHVVNTGVAGSLDNAIDIGDFVVSVDAVQHDYDVSPIGFHKGEIPYTGLYAFPADKALRERALAAIRAAAPEVHAFEGRICSGDQFIANKAQKNAITGTFGGKCCEMEGAAIAQVCYLNHIPFVILRAISDKADESEGIPFEQFADEAARRSQKVVAQMLHTLAE